MTTLMMVDVRPDEAPNEAVIRRIREGLAGIRLTVNRLAPLVGMSQQSLNERMVGKVEWRVNEISRVCEAADLSYIYVTTGIKAIPDGDGTSGAPTRARTWDLRIKSPQDWAEDPQIRRLPVFPTPVEPERIAA